MPHPAVPDTRLLSSIDANIVLQHLHATRKLMPHPHRRQVAAHTVRQRTYDRHKPIKQHLDF